MFVTEKFHKKKFTHSKYSINNMLALLGHIYYENKTGKSIISFILGRMETKLEKQPFGMYVETKLLNKNTKGQNIKAAFWDV